jgi:hypothetical protein
MGAFAEVRVASISGDKLNEIRAAREEADAQKIAAETLAAEELAQKYETAKSTGKPVLLRQWAAECCDPHEECNTDIVTEYAMPDGSTTTERQHTW